MISVICAVVFLLAVITIHDLRNYGKRIRELEDRINRLTSKRTPPYFDTNLDEENSIEDEDIDQVEGDSEGE
jgi:hypothetical protein